MPLAMPESDSFFSATVNAANTAEPTTLATKPPAVISAASIMPCMYQGYVETSNVNVAEELVNMIQVQRAYEINSKAVATTDQMLQKLTQL